MPECLNVGLMLSVSKMSTSIRDPYHLVGNILGKRYQLDQVAGAGGMSLVYQAQDVTSGKIVAVKVLRPDLLLRQGHADLFLKLFRQEAKAARSLTHPNILSVFDSGFEGDIAFIVMEWLVGRTVGQELLDIGRFKFDRTASILEQVCNALDIAHRQKTLHLDIKPSNIFLIDTEDGRDKVKVID